MIEENKIKEEQTLSEHLCEQLTTLNLKSKELQKEFKILQKIGKKLKKTIEKKKSDVELEKITIYKMKENLKNISTKNLQDNAKKYYKSTQKDSTLSEEEKMILKQMINQLHKTYDLSRDMAKTDLDLHKMITTIYQDDILDAKEEKIENSKI